MRKRETLNIIDDRFINFENETSVTLYIPNNVKSHKDYKQKHSLMIFMCQQTVILSLLGLVL